MPSLPFRLGVRWGQGEVDLLLSSLQPPVTLMAAIPIIYQAIAEQSGHPEILSSTGSAISANAPAVVGSMRSDSREQ